MAINTSRSPYLKFTAFFQKYHKNGTFHPLSTEVLTEAVKILISNDNKHLAQIIEEALSHQNQSKIESKITLTYFLVANCFMSGAAQHNLIEFFRGFHPPARDCILIVIREMKEYGKYYFQTTTPNETDGVLPLVELLLEAMSLDDIDNSPDLANFFHTSRLENLSSFFNLEPTEPYKVIKNIFSDNNLIDSKKEEHLGNLKMMPLIKKVFQNEKLSTEEFEYFLHKERFFSSFTYTFFNRFFRDYLPLTAIELTYNEKQQEETAILQREEKRKALFLLFQNLVFSLVKKDGHDVYNIFLRNLSDFIKDSEGVFIYFKDDFLKLLKSPNSSTIFTANRKLFTINQLNIAFFSTNAIFKKNALYNQCTEYFRKIEDHPNLPFTDKQNIENATAFVMAGIDSLYSLYLEKEKEMEKKDEQELPFSNSTKDKDYQNIDHWKEHSTFSLTVSKLFSYLFEEMLSNYSSSKEKLEQSSKFYSFFLNRMSQYIFDNYRQLFGNYLPAGYTLSEDSLRRLGAFINAIKMCAIQSLSILVQKKLETMNTEDEVEELAEKFNEIKLGKIGNSLFSLFTLQGEKYNPFQSEVINLVLFY